MKQTYLTTHSTPRLTIRPLTFEDAKAWEAFFMEDNPGLQFFHFNLGEFVLLCKNISSAERSVQFALDIVRKDARRWHLGSTPFAQASVPA